MSHHVVLVPKGNTFRGFVVSPLYQLALVFQHIAGQGVYPCLKQLHGLLRCRDVFRHGLVVFLVFFALALWGGLG